MNTLREAAQAALEALEAAMSDDKPYLSRCREASDLLSAALAGFDESLTNPAKDRPDQTPVAQKNPVNKPITREELNKWIEQTWNECQEKAWENRAEPVAWMNKEANVFAQHEEGAQNFGCTTPLYAHPPRSYTPMTNDDFSVAWCGSKGDIVGRLIPFARAIEREVLRRLGITGEEAK